jgi:DNA-binding TFAR19-related protein (PDSD5 family)
MSEDEREDREATSTASAAVAGREDEAVRQREIREGVLRLLLTSEARERLLGSHQPAVYSRLFQMTISNVS